MQFKLENYQFHYMLVIIFEILYSSLYPRSKNEKPVLKTQYQNLKSANAFGFIENKGQIVNENSKIMDDLFFKSSSGGVDLYITNQGLSYVFSKRLNPENHRNSNKINRIGKENSIKNDSSFFKFCRADMELVGADIRKENFQKELESSDKMDFYLGSICPNGILNVHKYQKLTVKNIYPGIDYAFNGKEKVDEIDNVTGSDYDYGMRMYDARIARFVSVDPLTKKYPELTPYQFAENTPIRAIDLDGLEKVFTTGGQQLTDEEAKPLFEKFDPSNTDVYSVSYFNKFSNGYTQSEYGKLTNLNISYNDFIEIATLAYGESGYNKDAAKGISNAIVNHHDVLKGSGARRYNGDDWNLASTMRKMRVYTLDGYLNGNNGTTNGNSTAKAFYIATPKQRNGNEFMTNAIAGIFNALSGGFDYSYQAVGWHGADVLTNTNWMTNYGIDFPPETRIGVFTGADAYNKVQDPWFYATKTYKASYSPNGPLNAGVLFFSPTGKAWSLDPNLGGL